MTNKKKKGDEGEKFVSDILKELGFLVEIHPRTSRSVIRNGKPLRYSGDNDYHNLFDIKAECFDFMIYAQVKVEETKNNTTKAQKSIDKEYPYEFPYQRIQTWQVWKEWVKEPRRHKEYKFRIQERRGFNDVSRNGIVIRKGKWTEIDIKDLEYHIPDVDNPLNSIGEVDE